MVYLPTFTIKINQMYVGKYVIHGSSGFPDFPRHSRQDAGIAALLVLSFSLYPGN